MRCPTCTSDVADGRRFCPSCGTPLAVTVGAAARATTSEGGDAPPEPPTRRLDVPEPAAGMPGPDARGADAAAFDGPPYPDEVTPTIVTRPPGATGRDHDRHGPNARERLAPAGNAVRRRARAAADRYRAAPADVRFALVGAVLTVVAFLVLPYATRVGTAAHLGGRLWWRPLAAVLATVLLATAGDRDREDGRDRAGGDGGYDRALAAVVVAAIGATEAGLVGIFSGATENARLGYYAMLAGLVTVLVATVRAARRRCRG